jgi:predicted nicotinamide N-methyase
MQIPYTIQQFDFGEEHVQLCVPDEAVIEERYRQEKLNGTDPVFPYWAKLWPASVALCEYIHAHPGIIKDKGVLELAAGLGLPSMLASKFARKVICSDYVEEALGIMQQSAALNHINNIEYRLINWNHYPGDLQADVILLSDINYDPAEFKILNQLLISLLEKGTIIVLSTPQRIMGKPFIESLLPYCKEKSTGHIETGSGNAEIFIMQLERND